MSGLSKDKAAELKAALDVQVGETNLKEPITKADLAFDQVRQQVTSLLAAYDPEGYEEYRKIKYASFEPTLEDRRKAYEFAFKRLLKVLYTKTLS